MLDERLIQLGAMIFVVLGVQDYDGIVGSHSGSNEIFSGVSNVLFGLPVKDSALVGLAAKEVFTACDCYGELSGECALTGFRGTEKQADALTICSEKSVYDPL